LRIQNNFAQISLILNVNAERARRIASELYRKERSSSAYASTYAFSLYTRGDKIGASKVMGALGDTQLNDPSVAAYYGLFLAAVGEKQKAREYFRIGASAKLLPEERALIAEAESSLKYGPHENDAVIPLRNGRCCKQESNYFDAFEQRRRRASKIVAAMARSAAGMRLAASGIGAIVA
jgi:hypothetical protein